ncbi:Glutamate-rich protein 6 [Holothuria leucospilota]|uniref:Glutamate-rich protein 6 n=1 Tax=Holothuria leucospilota TaxID=206669 RepID=A0A9Q1BQL4_HOLLE|nr:Glutamate-rich protein 6 [Holothuria leucospilota]
MNQPSERHQVKSPAVKEIHRNVVDGKEKVSVSIATETEWSWLESLKIAGVEEGKPLTPSSSHSQQKKAFRKSLSTPSHDSNFSNMSAHMGEDSEEEEEETDREDGEGKTRVPPLEIDADPEDDEAEVADTESLIPSIGPPRIIQYQRETDRPYPNENMAMSEDDDYDLGPIPGVSDTSLHLPEIQEEGAVCEYCHGEVKHFPTPEMRDNFTSEELYCCEDYQKFVEYAITNTPLSAQPSDELIDIAPHAPYGSKQARRAAKERAAARMREREIARQRAAGANQANFYACEFVFVFSQRVLWSGYHAVCFELI